VKTHRGISRRPQAGSFGRRRSRLPWILIIAVLVAAAVLAGRSFRPSFHVRRAVPPRPQAEVQVYFVRGASGAKALTLARAGRRVPRAPVEGLAASALQALFAGPSRGERSHGLLTEIPAGTVLRGVTISGDLATVDVGVSFAQGGGSSSMLARVWQVVYTATQFRGVTSVQLLIGGRRVDTLGGEGLMIGAPMRRPATMPTF
jgi:spore germination protein GerM